MSHATQSAISLWRIATDAADYPADDTSGRGAELTGGRWNRKGTPMIYSSISRALACLETVVHLRADDLPLNRYLVEVNVPVDVWKFRTMFDDALVGWDAEPSGITSMDWGTGWAMGGSTLLAEVPSVIVPEESNLLINPRHADAQLLSARKIRRWNYDSRLRVKPPSLAKIK